jgi:hypothetical protein
VFVGSESCDRPAVGHQTEFAVCLFSCDKLCLASPVTQSTLERVQVKFGEGRAKPTHSPGSNGPALPVATIVSLYARQAYVFTLTVCSIQYTVGPGYNDICLSDISSITSDVLRYQLIPYY